MYSNNDFRYYKEDNYLAHYGIKGMKWKKRKTNAHMESDAERYRQGANEMAKENRDYHKSFNDIRTKKAFLPLKKKLASSDNSKHVVDSKYYSRSKKEDASWARKLRKKGNRNSNRSRSSVLSRLFGR